MGVGDAPAHALAVAEGAVDILEFLFEFQRARVHFPVAFYFGRNDPHIGGAAFGGVCLVRRPVFHREGMRYDTRAGFHVENGRAQLDVQVGQQVHRQHRGLAEVGGEDVAADELHFFGDAFLLRVAFRQLDHVRVVFNAGGA